MSTKITGLEELNKTLKRLEIVTSPAQMKSTMHTVGDMIIYEAEDSFKNQADPWGNKWKPISYLTAKARYKGKTHTKDGKRNTKGFLKKFGAGGEARILYDTGHLESSFEVTATPRGVEVGTGKLYAAIHQFGGDAGRGKKVKIQARPFFPIDKNGELKEELVDKIKEQITQELEKALK